MATEVSDVSKPFMSGIKSMETTHKPLLVLRCKVVVVGDSTVGKSALVQMFHSGDSTYPRNYVMTTWVDFSVQAALPVASTCYAVKSTFIYGWCLRGIMSPRGASAPASGPSFWPLALGP